MKKRIALLFSVLIFLYLLFSSRHNLLPVFSVSNITKDELENELLVALFLKILILLYRSIIQTFSIPLEVYNYEIQIIDMFKEQNIITIRLGVTPQIGAHNPVGYDEITFSVDNNGQRELLTYKHIKTYTLDKRFNEYIINPIPK